MSCKAGSVGYCLSSEGKREYGSVDYCIASTWNSGAVASPSPYDQADRGHGESRGQCSLSDDGRTYQLAREGFANLSNGPSQTSMAALTEAVTGFSQATQPLSQTTTPLNQSVQSLSLTTLLRQQQVTSLKEEKDKLNALLNTQSDKLRSALQRKIAEKAAATAATNAAAAPNCSWRGYVDAGLEAITDQMIAQNTPRETIEQAAFDYIVGRLRPSGTQNLDAVQNEILGQIDAFTKGWIAHRSRCIARR